MFDHIGLTVTDITKGRAFFDSALKPLGIGLVLNVPPERNGGTPYLGYGSSGKPYFWVGTGGQPTGRMHMAFTAESRDSVDAFYAAALANGGRDNGPPGIRAHYHANYYAAYVLDFDGHNIEAVCHARPSSRLKDWLLALSA